MKLSFFIFFLGDQRRQKPSNHHNNHIINREREREKWPFNDACSVCDCVWWCWWWWWKKELGEFQKSSIRPLNIYYSNQLHILFQLHLYKKESLIILIYIALCFLRPLHPFSIGIVLYFSEIYIFYGKTLANLLIIR